MDTSDVLIYYIENTIDERRTSITAYFPTLDAAKEGLKDCADWWCPKGTGRIYSVGFGLHAKRTLVYEGKW